MVEFTTHSDSINPVVREVGTKLFSRIETKVDEIVEDILSTAISTRVELGVAPLPDYTVVLLRLAMRLSILKAVSKDFIS